MLNNELEGHLNDSREIHNDFNINVSGFWWEEVTLLLVQETSPNRLGFGVKDEMGKESVFTFLEIYFAYQHQ